MNKQLVTPGMINHFASPRLYVYCFCHFLQAYHGYAVYFLTTILLFFSLIRGVMLVEKFKPGFLLAA